MQMSASEGGLADWQPPHGNFLSYTNGQLCFILYLAEGAIRFLNLSGERDKAASYSEKHCSHTARVELILLVSVLSVV